MIGGIVLAIISFMFVIPAAKSSNSRSTMLALRFLLWSIMFACAGAAHYNHKEPSMGIVILGIVWAGVLLHAVILVMRDNDHLANIIITLAIAIVSTTLFFKGHQSIIITVSVKSIGVLGMLICGAVLKGENESRIVEKLMLWFVRVSIYGVLLYCGSCALINPDTKIGITMLCFGGLLAICHLIFYQLFKWDPVEIISGLISTLIVVFATSEYLGITAYTQGMQL